jgi:hypothetical protein
MGAYPTQAGILPPPVPPHMQVHPKRSKALLPIFIVGYILFYLFMIFAIIMALVPYSNEVQVSEVDRMAEKYGLEAPDDLEVPFGGYDIGYSIDEEDTGFDTYGNDSDEYSYEDSVEDSVGNAETLKGLYPNYDTFIQGRELQAYEQFSEIVMENGVGFYLNDIVVNDRGDGTASVDARIDLASYSAENYLYLEDFMLLPMDQAGNALSDACSVEYITDSDGNAVLTPMLLDTEEYQNYTISFIVPTELMTFNVYGTNYSTEGFVGPAYYIEMQVDE